MLTQQSICAILNPAAGNGQAGREKYNIGKSLSKHFTNWTIWETQGPRHATALAKKAAEEGYDIVAAIGGDGSCHEVVNGLMQAPKESRPTLAVIPFGTGGDFRKSLDIPKSVNKAVAIAAKGRKQTIDIGTATVTTDSGKMERFFVNVAGFGANGEVAEKSNRWSKRFGGRITFLNATIHTTFTYRSPKIQMKWIGTEGKENVWTGELLSCFIANASFCGGGMRVAPKDALGDGQLHLRLLPKLSVPSQLMHLPKLYSDEIYKVEGSVVGQTIQVEVAPTKGSIVQIDLDGELSGRLPAAFGLSPTSLTVMRQ
jgi:YegS/Rv2252/BmrU family lipid kinase